MAKPKSGPELSRRDFLAAAAGAFAVKADAGGAKAANGPFAGRLCLFSKLLPEMDARRMARSLKLAGFDGIDLTVRPGGHVLPERAAEELPKAVRAIREEGLEAPMITTALVSAADPTAEAIVSTAGKLSIPFLKPGYYKYEFVDVRRELERAGREFRGLAELVKRYGVQVGYHNHSGYMGAPLWDVATWMDGLDPKWAGYYFDVRHAVAEGGDAGWKIAANLVSRRLKMIAIKDFYWEKSAARGWRIRSCPLGEGMVDWGYYFKLLSRAGFNGPVSLHIEYEIEGRTPADREEKALMAAARDLKFIKARLAESYGS